MAEASFEKRLERMEDDLADMRADIKALLAAHNMGRGFWFTAQVGAGIIAAAAGLAAAWHYVIGTHP